MNLYGPLVLLNASGVEMLTSFDPQSSSEEHVFALSGFKSWVARIVLRK